MVSGFINLYKEAGISSALAVAKVKRLLKECGIVTKVGHFGTLDPDGEGVLPIALGYATRLFSYDLEKRKVYYTEFCFGSETDTLDASGQVIFQGGSIPNKAQIENTLSKLQGIIEQLPPNYSAKQINGQRAYKLARQGKQVSLPKAKVNIYNIELIEKLAFDTFSFRIECSSGTYIRSIARDLAYALGTYAYMKYIKREKSSIFDIKDAVPIELLQQSITDYILPMQIFTNAFARYDIADSLADKLYNGAQVSVSDAPSGMLSIYCKGQLFGLGEKDEFDKLKIKTRLTK